MERSRELKRELKREHLKSAFGLHSFRGGVRAMPCRGLFTYVMGYASYRLRPKQIVLLRLP